jgi:hypothetical protein
MLDTDRDQEAILAVLTIRWNGQIIGTSSNASSILR